MSEGEINERSAPEYKTAEFVSPYAALAEELYRERVIEARKMSPEEKILAGQRLFEDACEITLAGIRNQYPEQTEEENIEMLRTRLEWRRKRQATT